MEKRLTMFFACLFLSVGMALAQTKVTGTVISQEDGQPIIGAAVKVVGTSQGMLTDVNGRFSLTLPAGKSDLEVTYLGYEGKTVKAKNGMRVFLKGDAKVVDEVVVVAYGTAKRQSITGSVSVVGEDDIKDRIATSVTAALEGAAPGIQVNNTYGEPGAAPSIRIRGIGSLVSGASAPLYVVDGAPYDGNIADINPADIENMSVLKDAASAALYGNRAANGVVLITTKKGKGNKPSLNVTINEGFYSRGIPEYARLGADQWMEVSWKALRNSAMSGTMGLDAAAAAEYASNNLISSYVKRNIYDAENDALFDAYGNLIANRMPGYTDTDWEDAIERTGHRQEYNISGSIAGEKYNIYASAGYLNEKGYVKGSDFERFTGRFNTQFTPNKWFKAGLSMNGVYSNRNYNSNATGNYYANPFYVARYMAPVYPVYMHNDDGSFMLDEEGNKIFDTTSAYLDNRNIVYERTMDQQNQHRSVIEGQAFGTLMLPYGFSLTLKADLMHSNVNELRYNNPLIGDGATNGGRLRSYANQFNSYTVQEILNWEHDFGKHHVDAMLGHENYSWKAQYENGMNTGMVVDGVLTMGNFQTLSTHEGNNDVDKLESYFFRARYNYNEKYFADFSWRRDGSSRFHKDNRWGNFFSFGLNWNAKKENFLKDVKWIDQLRVRASYGEVGNNTAASLYAYQALYYMDKNGGNPAFVKATLAAKDLKWETAQTFDLAVEGRFFNILDFSIGYFNKRNKDLLFETRLPFSAGSFAWADISNMTQMKNIGTLSNRGLELSLGADIINNKNWNWRLGFDATFISSKIKKLPDGKDILHGLQKYSEGHDPYEFFTYHFVGVDQMTGMSLYTLDPEMEEDALEAGTLVEINGTQYTTDTTYGKRDWAGSAHPDVYGSFSSKLRWKNLTLNMLFTYSLGGKVFDASYQSLMSTNTAASASANHIDLLNAWNGVPDGMTVDSPNRINPNGIPVIDFTQSTYTNSTSDRWLTSASYFVFKNLTLSYDLPKNWIHRLGLEGLTVNFGAENLFTITSRKGLNPQYSFSGGSDDTYVTARVFNFGVSVKF